MAKEERYPVSHGRERYQSKTTCMKTIRSPWHCSYLVYPSNLRLTLTTDISRAVPKFRLASFKQLAKMSAAHKHDTAAYFNGKVRERRGKARSSVACLSCRVRKVRCDVVIGSPCSNCKLDMIGEHCQMPLCDLCSY